MRIFATSDLKDTTLTKKEKDFVSVSELNA